MLAGLPLPAWLLIPLVLVALERLLRGPKTDWWINLQSWAIQIVCVLFVYDLVQRWHGAALIDAASLPAPLAVVVYLLVFDLAEWLFHYAQHRIPLLWSMHSLHHSDPEMSVLTTNRHFWADHVLKTLTVWSAAAMVISATPTALAVYVGLSYWNYVVHSQWQLNLGRWSWLINSPAYHRRHHSRLPEHFDTNFAALFPIWDVLVGTYRRPDGFPPSGLDQRPQSLADLLLWPLRKRSGPTTP